MSPISSSTYAKLLIYLIALLPPTIMLVGIVPMIFFVFGLFMASKTRDFGHIQTASRNIIIYVLLVVIVCACFSADSFWRYHESGYRDRYLDDLMLPVILGCIAIAYGLLTRFFFGAALGPYRLWIEEHGLFASKRSLAAKHATSDLEIIKSEKFRQYSVADELLKWSKLFEDGHVGREEFEQIKGRLMGKAV